VLEAASSVACSLFKRHVPHVTCVRSLAGRSRVSLRACLLSCQVMLLLLLRSKPWVSYLSGIILAPTVTSDLSGTTAQLLPVAGSHDDAHPVSWSPAAGSSNTESQGGSKHAGHSMKLCSIDVANSLASGCLFWLPGVGGGGGQPYCQATHDSVKPLLLRDATRPVQHATG
jgi:hypothetical protein